MKHLYLILWLMLASSGLAQYNADPTPQPQDTENISLKKVNKILNDARAGTSPLSTTGGGASGGATETTLSALNAKVTAVNTGAVTVSAALPAGTNTIGNTIPVLGTSAGVSIVSSTALETSHVVKASAGTLVSLVGYNSKASAQFIQVYNSATVPADTAVPIYSFTVAATSNFSLDIPITGAPFSTGISVANSSTAPTKTVGSADCFFTAVYK